MSGAAEPDASPAGLLRRAAAELGAAVRGRVHEGRPLAPFTSFRLGGPSAVLVEPADEEDLEAAGRVLASLGLVPLVLGRGTNVLVSDAGYGGVVLRLGRGFEWVRGRETAVEAGGSAPLPRVANWAARRGLAGLEFAVAIPATVGGGVRMNAGAHGCSVSDVLAWASVYRAPEARRVRLAAADLGMSYRVTALRPGDVVCSAGFALREGDRAEIAAAMESYRDHRARTQPADAPNAGSMFRNPPGDAAGRLIEACGLKGHRVGAVEVSPRHANFFLAHPGATAQQVYDLMAAVQGAVLGATGVLLVPEVRLLGPFDRAAGLREAP